MKLSLRELPQSLKNIQSLKYPIFWVAGDEFLQKQEASALIMQALKKTADLNFPPEILSLSIDKNFEPAVLIQALSEPSLFANQQIIKINIEDAIPAAFLKTLGDSLPNFPPNISLIISSPKIPYPKQQENLFKTLESQLILIQIWPIDSSQLTPWIKEKAARMGLNLHPTAIHYLAQSTEGNLLATYQALEKLTYLGEPEITLSTMESIQADMAHFDLFNLIDAWLQKDKLLALRIFNSLLQQDTELTYILWALTQEIRTLAQLHLEKNLTDAVFKQYKIYDKRKPIIQTALRHYPLSNCYSLLQNFSKIDRQIKGITPGEARQSIQQILLA